MEEGLDFDFKYVYIKKNMIFFKFYTSKTTLEEQGCIERCVKVRSCDPNHFWLLTSVLFSFQKKKLSILHDGYNSMVLYSNDTTNFYWVNRIDFSIRFELAVHAIEWCFIISTICRSLDTNVSILT